MGRGFSLYFYEMKYFKVGLRPVYYKEENDESFVFVFNWENGKFEDDFTYYKKIFSGPEMDDVEELSEQEFNEYVTKLRQERNLK